MSKAAKWRAAHEKLTADPRALTDADIALIAEFDGPKWEREARKIRFKALNRPSADEEAQAELEKELAARRPRSTTSTPTRPQAVRDTRKSVADIPSERHEHYRQFIKSVSKRNVPYDTARFVEGHQRFLEDPATVRDEDIEQFAVVSEVFALRALHKRDGFHADWELEDSDPVMRVSDFLKWEFDHDAPIGATHVYRIRELLSRVERLEDSANGARPGLKTHDASVETRLHVLEAREAQANKRLETLELRPGLTWRGVFQHSASYAQGALVRWGGTVYIAKAPGSGIVPGDKSPMSSVMWDVFSERGRQGKTGERAT